MTFSSACLSVCEVDDVAATAAGVTGLRAATDGGRGGGPRGAVAGACASWTGAAEAVLLFLSAGFAGATVAVVADSPIVDEFVWTIRNVGIEHVLFGSDYPQYSLAANLAALERLPLTEDEKKAIRIGNAARLLGLAAPK